MPTCLTHSALLTLTKGRPQWHLEFGEHAPEANPRCRLNQIECANDLASEPDGRGLPGRADRPSIVSQIDGMEKIAHLTAASLCRRVVCHPT